MRSLSKTGCSRPQSWASGRPGRQRTLDADLVENLDHLVAARQFANRSQAIESAVAEKLGRLARTRLARECAKLDPQEEKALAEEGLAGAPTQGPSTEGRDSLG